jgi:hypothetical protein
LIPDSSKPTISTGRGIPHPFQFCTNSLCRPNRSNMRAKGMDDG